MATALVITLAVAGALLTIPEVRALGAGLLASAGLISVVAALAVQSSLANVFAGLQIAFTDAIRVNDTVVVETQRGAIEEITLTYVVVLLLDGRRLIIPSTYFTTTPFENWSRRSTEINGIGAAGFELERTDRAPAHPHRAIAGIHRFVGRAHRVTERDRCHRRHPEGHDCVSPHETPGTCTTCATTSAST